MFVVYIIFAIIYIPISVIFGLANSRKYRRHRRCNQSSKISQNSPESIPPQAVPEGIIRHKVYQSCVVSL